MPSVRIKRTDYAQLGDQTNEPSTFPRALGSIFPSAARPGSAGGETTDVVSQTQSVGRARGATISSSQEAPRLPSPVIRRPRAGSRVADHVMSRTSATGLRNQRSVSSVGRGGGGSRRSSTTRRSPVPAGMVVMEGPQAEVIMQSEGEEPGILGSALSLPHTELSDTAEEEHHHDDIVEHLDVIDPQVATVSNLTNAANSILIPPLSFYSRKPIVFLSAPTPQGISDLEKGDLPEGESVKHEDALDRHVEDVLARPSKFKRTLRGVWSFLKTPMGVVTGIYGFLVVFFGAGIIFCLVPFIPFHNSNTQGFWVELTSQIENGLFTLTGIGLIPVRTIDTYRMYKIWAYKRRTRKLRAKAGLPQLYDIDDLPDPAYDPAYVHVLNDREQADLHNQQIKFQQSQTWYRPHGTETHRAFPIGTALLICLLIDGNSFFQIILCGTMWGLNRFERPAWSTGILIPASFLCGIIAAIFIWRGGQKTKRTKEVEERLRLALAMDQGHEAFLQLPDASDPRNDDTAGATAPTLTVNHPIWSGRGQEKSMRDVDVDERMTVPSTLKQRK